jgi:ferritin-like metal-binding protein YciE
MPINNSPNELFVRMLSDVRQRTERMTKIYQELSGIAQDPNIKEALESRVAMIDELEFSRSSH